MSFDLYVFDMDDVPEDEEALGELMEDSTRWDAPPTPRLKVFIEELEKRYPGLDDDDPDESPWAGWPLGDTMLDGRCASLSVVWSQAERMSRELRSACTEAGLILYDPQASQVIRPVRDVASPSPTRRRWWARPRGR